MFTVFPYFTLLVKRKNLTLSRLQTLSPLTVKNEDIELEEFYVQQIKSKFSVFSLWDLSVSLIHEEGVSSTFRKVSASTCWHTHIAQPLYKWMLIVTDFSFQSPHFPLELLKRSSNSISNQKLDIRIVLIFHYADLIPAITHKQYTYPIYLTPSFYVQFLFIFSFNKISLPYSECLYTYGFKLAELTELISVLYHLSNLLHTVLKWNDSVF